MIISKQSMIRADILIKAAGDDGLEKVRVLTGREMLSILPGPTGMADVAYDGPILAS